MENLISSILVFLVNIGAIILVFGVFAYQFFLCPRSPAKVEAEWHDSQVTIKWTTSLNAKAYQVFSKLKSSPIKDWKVVYKGNAITYSFNITNGRYYEFYVVAKNEYGRSFKSCTIVGRSRTPAPTYLDVLCKPGDTAVTLKWSPVRKTTGYVVKRATSNLNDKFTIIQTVNDPLVTTISDSNLIFGTTYRYTIVSMDFDGESICSKEESACPRVPSPVDVTVSHRSTDTFVTIEWTSVAGSTGYAIKRCSTRENDTFANIEILHNPLETKFKDHSLEPCVGYRYVIASLDTLGESICSQEKRISPHILPPKNVMATYESEDTFITISWKPVDNSLGYIVKRSTNELNDRFKIIKQVKDPSIKTFKDTDFVIGTRYCYVIASIGYFCEGIASDKEFIHPRAIMPTNLTVSHNPGSDSIVLNWIPVKVCQGYVVKRSTNKPNDTFVQIKRITISSVTQFEDTNFIFGIKYNYVVASLDSSGESLSCSNVSICPRVLPPTNLTVVSKSEKTAIVLNWTLVKECSGYIVKRSTNKPNDTFVQIKGITSSSVTQFEDTNFKFGIKYSYVIASLDSAGENLCPEKENICVRAPAPEKFTGTLHNNSNTIALRWTTVPHSTGYVIKRATGSPTALFITIGTLNDVRAESFHDFLFKFGVQYYYSITSIDEIGESEKSNPISIIYRVPIVTDVKIAFDSIKYVVRIQWTPISNCTGYIFQRKIASIAGSFSTIASITDPTIGYVEDANIILGTNYVYTIISTDEGDRTNWASTGPVAVECPRAHKPIGLTASFDKNKKCIIIQWTAVLRCKGYVLVRLISTADRGYLDGMWDLWKGSPTNPPVTIATLNDSTIIQTNDTTFTYGIKYDYILYAVDEIDKTEPTVLSSICYHPPLPNNFRASYTQNEGKLIKLEWTAVMESKGYVIRRAIKSVSATYYEIKRINDATIGQFEDTSIKFGNLYYYTITSLDEKGESKQSDPIGVICPWVPVPAYMTALYSENNQSIILQWTPVENMKGYIIKRAENSSSSQFDTIETLDNSATKHFEDLTFLYGINYYYTVSTIDKSGESNPSTAVNIHVPFPLAKNVTASFQNTNNKTFISIKWDPVPKISGYIIKRSTEPSTDPASIISTLDCTSDTSFNDESVLYGKTYVYSIHLSDIAGESISSSNVKVVCPRSPSPSNVEIKIPTNVGGIINVSWSTIENCSGYAIYRSLTPFNNNNYSQFLIKTISYSTVGSYIDSTVQNGIQYYYTIASIDATGISARSTDVSGKATLSSSTDICAKIVYNQKTILLSWSGVQGATGYRIARKNKHGHATIIEHCENKPQNTFSDADIVFSNAPYTYTITAFDNISEGKPSKSVTVSSPFTKMQAHLVTVRYGNLLTEQVDAIVVCSTSDALLGSVLKASGVTVTDAERKDSIKSTNGRLPCKNIIFHSIEWNHYGNVSLEASIRKFISCTINRAIEANCNTIAFPAIGCGGYGNDAKVVAAAMISEIYVQLQIDQSIHRRITIVIEAHKTDIFQRFSEHIKTNEDHSQLFLSQNEPIPDWDIVDDKYPLQIELSESSEEYIKIIRGFQATMETNNRGNRVRIERIQNERLYRQYQIERKHFKDNLNQGAEKILYHGCPNVDATLKSIMDSGFDRSRAGQQTGTLYGRGTYFSTKASESHYYTQPHSQTGERVMFACLVLLGKSTQGNSRMNICPEGYHSTTNGSTIYVIYRDAQAYPNYLIHYGGK